MKIMDKLVLIVALGPGLLAGCSTIEKARGVSDAAIVGKEILGLQALRQAQTERQRARAARCHSPLLTPATISAAATDADLGEPWIEELLRDCPEFSALLSNLVLKRARTEGLCAS
jgi:predicted lipoprotein